MKSIDILSTSSNQTMNIAKTLAKYLSKGDTVVLTGELGSGKTKFTEGFLAYYGLEEEISSPTFNIVNEYIVSAAINTSTSIYCIDGDSLVGDDVSGDFYNVLQSHCSNFYLATSRTDIVQFIHDIYEIYSARKKSNESGIIFIIIKNLQFLDIIKSMLKGEIVEESEYIETENDSTPAVDNSDPFASLNNFISSRSNSSNNLSNSNEKLLKLIEDGSGFGIHFVISSLEYQTVKDCMHYGENSLAKFPERIIFSLNDNDADNLVENVSVTGLRDNTVYFTDGVKDTYQMKPYIAPTAMELEHFLSSLN